MELKEYPSVSRWFNRLSPSTARGYDYHMKSFLKWGSLNGGPFAGMNPDELIVHQKGAGNGELYDILDLLQRYVTSQEGRIGYKERMYAAIRSFFLHNRAELPKDPNYRIRGDAPKVVGDLKPEEVRDVILASKPVYHAAFLCMFQGTLDQEMFTHWNLNGYEKLQRDLANLPPRREDHIIRIDLPGRKKLKNKRPYYTLIGPDAIDAVKHWLSLRPSMEPTFHPDDMGKRREERRVIDEKPTTAIFIDQFCRPLTKGGLQLYWIRHLRKLGLTPQKEKYNRRTRTGKNLHELRDLFRSQWEKSPAKASVAEYMMGHVVDPLEYNKAFRDDKWTAKEYKKALPMLQIISSGRPFGQVNEDELEKLRGENKDLRRQIENAQTAQDQKIADMEEQLRLIQEYLKKGRDNQ